MVDRESGPTLDSPGYVFYNGKTLSDLPCSEAGDPYETRACYNMGPDRHTAKFQCRNLKPLI